MIAEADSSEDRSRRINERSLLASLLASHEGVKNLAISVRGLLEM